MSTLRTTNIIHGSSAISNIVLDNQGRAIFGPDSPAGRAALYVNAQNNRVGVNTENPGVELDVDGQISATGNATIGGTLDVTGNIAIDTDTLFVDTANQRVGINTNSPEQTLHVVNPASSPGTIRLANTEGFFDIVTDGGDGYFALGTEKIIRLQHDGTIPKVGINHDAPVTLLDARDSRTHTYSPAVSNSTEQTAFFFTNNDSGLANQCASLTLRVSANGSTNNAIATLNAIAIGNASNNTNVTLQVRSATAGIIEALRVRETGQVLIGGQQNISFGSFANPAGGAQIQGDTYSKSSLALVNYQNAIDGPYLLFGHSRNPNIGGNTALIDNDALGAIWFSGSDGNQLWNSARIEAKVNGTVATSSIPSRLRFLITNKGATTPSSRGQVSDDGRWVLGTSESRTSPESKYPLEITSPSDTNQYQGIFNFTAPYISRSGSWMTANDNDLNCAVRFTIKITGNVGYIPMGIHAIAVASNSVSTVNVLERIIYKFNVNTTVTPANISDIAVVDNIGTGVSWTLTTLGESTDADGVRFLSFKLVSSSSGTTLSTMTANLISYITPTGGARLFWLRLCFNVNN